MWLLIKMLFLVYSSIYLFELCNILQNPYFFNMMVIYRTNQKAMQGFFYDGGYLHQPMEDSLNKDKINYRLLSSYNYRNRTVNLQMLTNFNTKELHFNDVVNIII